MMSNEEIMMAAANGTALKDFDGEVGVPTGQIDTDGETIVARIVGENFARWSDTLDLEPVNR